MTAVNKTIQGKPTTVFECDQANGECLNAKGYPNSIFQKNGGAPQRAPARNGASNGAARSGVSEDVVEFRIVRQHSQEMALRLAAINGVAFKTPEELDKLRKLISWFQHDATNMPKAAAKIAPKPEPEPEPEPQPQVEAPSDDIF
jgi:hypothetical protein